MPRLFQHFGDVDPERVIEGVLEYLPTIAIPDFTLTKYASAFDAIIDYEWILQKTRKT